MRSQQEAVMNIGIIGSGNMGRTLGLLWATKGHQVFFGTRDLNTHRSIEQLATVPVETGTLSDAIRFGDVLLYCLRDILPSQLAPATDWAGKVLIDCNNSEIPPDYNFPPVEQSYAERFQIDLPTTLVVKAFNTVAQETYNHPTDFLRAQRVAGLLCGDDQAAKTTVAQLISEVGLTPLDCGPLCLAKSLESFADLVRYLMIDGGQGVNITFSATILPEAPTQPFGPRQ
ncbi:NADPH-dependent F420 reductase [Spirosoma arcticum]